MWKTSTENNYNTYTKENSIIQRNNNKKKNPKQDLHNKSSFWLPIQVMMLQKKKKNGNVTLPVMISTDRETNKKCECRAVINISLVLLPLLPELLQLSYILRTTVLNMH